MMKNTQAGLFSKKRLVATGSLIILTLVFGACTSPTVESRHNRISGNTGPRDSQTDNPFAREFESQPGGKNAGTPGFDWPVNEARLTRGFFTRPKKRRGRPHLGIDLAAIQGTPIYASHGGLILYVGKEFRGYGRMVMIEGRDGYATLYAESAFVKVNWLALWAVQAAPRAFICILRSGVRTVRSTLFSTFLAAKKFIKKP